MLTEEDRAAEFRRRAAGERAIAAQERLASKRHIHLQSAARWEEMAAQAELTFKLRERNEQAVAAERDRRRPGNRE